MLASDDPAQLTPEERFDEVAKILARGLLRSKKAADLTANQKTRTANLQNPSEYGTAGLNSSSTLGNRKYLLQRDLRA